MARIILTNESIMETRKYYADLALLCIEDAKTGKTRVNDLDKYIAWEMELHDRALSGESDHTFTFQQHAVWLQTGVCHALLP